MLPLEGGRAAFGVGRTGKSQCNNRGLTMKTSYTPPARNSLPARLVDSGRVRFGAGVGIIARRRG